MELLKASARQRLAAGRASWTSAWTSAWPMPGWWAYDALGVDVAADADEVFRSLVLARIVEPTRKLDSLRVLEETGVRPPSYRTVCRRLPAYAEDSWRERLATLCAPQ